MYFFVRIKGKTGNNVYVYTRYFNLVSADFSK